MTRDPPVAERIADLADRLGIGPFVAVCVDLLGGAAREQYVAELVELSAHDAAAVRDAAAWKDYWLRTWGARGLLHVWDDSAADAVVAGLADEHWRPAEMCLKVVAAHEVAGAGDGVAVLADHDLPRVRAQTMRALAVVGDTEHVQVVRDARDDEDPAVRAQAVRALEAMRVRLDLD